MMSFGGRCGACGSTAALAVPHKVPRTEVKSLDISLDTIPFSESFSGLFHSNDSDEDDEDNERSEEESIEIYKAEMSYNVEQFSDIKYVDSEWDDEDIEEVMILSSKQQHNTLPTISEERDALSIASIEARCSQALPNADHIVTLADFDIIPSSGYHMLCRRRSTNKVYVVKTLEASLGPEPHTEALVMETIRALRAPFLERVYWSFPGVADGEEGRIVHLVLESHPSGSLLELIRSGPISPTDARFYVCEVAEGLSTLHAANIIYRDLSPSNILIDHMGHVVLSNFCNAALFSATKAMPPSATMEYLAPEILLGWTHDFAVDCWSFGVLLHFLLTGTNTVFEDDGSVRDQTSIDSGEVLAQEARHLVSRCLERNPILRLTIRGITKHNYFNSVDWCRVREKNVPPPARSLPLPKLRPTSQDFPLPPKTRLSYCLDTSLDIPFTLHTASKAVPFQPRLERVHGRERVNDTSPFRSYSSMDDLRDRFRQRLSLNVQSNSAGTSLGSGRPRSMRDAGTPSSCPVDIDPSELFQPFSPRLSMLIQSPDSLPTIFRPTPLEDPLVEEEEPAYSSPGISSPTVCELSPRERMNQFWERLDAEEGGSESGSSVASLELRDALKLALPCPPLPISRPHRMRKRASILATPQPQSDHRFSIISATHITTNRLRKLRRPISTPLIARRSEPILDLPPGIEQIGKGIGFTYTMPVASHSKASICVATAPSAAGRLLREGLGIGKGLLRRVKSQPKLPPADVAAHRTRGPPARIQILPGYIAPGMYSPVSDEPLTPDSLTFPPLPEILGDPFAKDEVGDEVRIHSGLPDATLRLVSGNSADHKFSPTMQPLDNFIFTSWTK